MAKTHFIAPVHAINVFVPLVDLTMDKGPTEFIPGSRRLRRPERLAHRHVQGGLGHPLRLPHQASRARQPIE